LAVAAGATTAPPMVNLQVALCGCREPRFKLPRRQAFGPHQEKVVEAYMREFVTSQVLGLDGLVNLSNIVFLVAFSVRGVLRLRVLSLVGEGVMMPYYYFQHDTLWPPLFWGVAFMAVNAVRIIALALERRPVVLSDREEQLYRLAFSTVEKHEFLELVTLARWIDCSPGEVILRKGQQILDVIVLVSGETEAVLNGIAITLHPGQLIGDAGAYSGLASPADVLACSRGTLAVWDLQHLREFTKSRPELRAKFLQIVSVDLAAKLRDVAAAASGHARPPIASGAYSSSA
jgi:CRP-like cAMP-binding protein